MLKKCLSKSRVKYAEIKENPNISDKLLSCRLQWLSFINNIKKAKIPATLFLDFCSINLGLNEVY